MAGLEVVELARAAVRRLGEAAPTAAVARATLEAIEKVGKGPPYTVAIAGDLAARSALLDCLAGERLFDPQRRDPPRVVLTMRRGASTGMRVRRRGGAVEVRSFGSTASGALIVEDKLIVEEAPVARRAPVTQEARPETATQLVRRLPWWAFWRRFWQWLRAWRARRHRELEPVKPVTVDDGWVEEPAPPEKPAPSMPQLPPEMGVDPRREFVEGLTALFADETVESVLLEVAGAALPEKLVVIELPSGADPNVLGAAGADACIVACGATGYVQKPQLDDVLAIVPHLFAVGTVAMSPSADPRVRHLASFAAVAPALITLASIERGIAIGVRAVAAVSTGRVTLDGLIRDAETEFRERIEALEARRIPSVEARVGAELSRLRPAIIEHGHRSLRRALTRIEAEVSRVTAGWVTQVEQVTATDTLRAAATKLDEESPGELRAIRAEARKLLVDDLTEHARAQYLEIVSSLREGTARSDPLPAWLTVDLALDDATSGTGLGAVAPRLSSLFKSLDAIKTHTLEQLQQRIEILSQVSISIFADSEPRLEPAVTGTIAIALRADLERHNAWVEAELVREHAAIETERAKLASLAAVAETARSDERDLAAALAALEAKLP